MDNEKIHFIQQNSSDGGFLQSPEWRKFQEGAGRKTHHIFSEVFWANVIEHELPIVGKYFYVPRGPISSNVKHETWNKGMEELMIVAKKNKAGWIRIEPASREVLEIIKENVGNAHVHSQNGNAYMRSLRKHKIIKAPHDMQPKEIFMIDITQSEEELLSEMKPKTRYNVRLAGKKGVSVRISNCLISNSPSKITNKLNSDDQNTKHHINEFLRLTEVMAKRNGIVAHSENYYRKMMEMIPGDVLKLYLAEYQGKIIAANLVGFYGNTCTYLHGASDDSYRNVMAPYLLQWQQIKDAKAVGCTRYDFGGIKIENKGQRTRNNKNTWQGITKFKLGFSPNTQPVVFPGSYDVIVSPGKYWLYRLIQIFKSLVR